MALAFRNRPQTAGLCCAFTLPFKLDLHNQWYLLTGVSFQFFVGLALFAFLGLTNYTFRGPGASRCWDDEDLTGRVAL